VKSIRVIQYERVRALYQDLLRSRNEVAVSDVLDIMRREILQSQYRLPLSGSYRIKGYEPIDVNKWNTELGLIAADAETLYEYMCALDARFRDLAYVISVWNEYTQARAAKATSSLIQFTAPLYIKGFTEPLNLVEAMDPDATTLSVTGNGELGLTISHGASPGITYTRKDISIQRIGNEGIASVYGDPGNIMNRHSEEGLQMVLQSISAVDAGFCVDMNVNAEAANFVSIHLGKNTHGMRVVLEVSEDGSTFDTVYDAVVSRDYVDVPFTSRKVTRAKVSLTMSNPNIVTADDIRYEFFVHHILFMLLQRTLNGEYQSRRIDLENDISFVSVVVDDEVIKNAEIMYYVTTDEDEDGNPVGFTRVVPGQESALIPIGAQDVSLPIKPALPVWKITPDSAYGGRLFNVFDGCVSAEGDSYSIADGVLTMKSADRGSYRIIPETMKLYRGIRDFIKKYTELTMERQVTAITYAVSEQPATEWVMPVHLKTRNRKVIDKARVTSTGDGTYNVVKITGAVTNYEEISIEREDGIRIQQQITDISFDGIFTSITFAEPVSGALIDPAYYHYITYVTTLQSYIEDTGAAVTILPEGFTVMVGSELLHHGTDYLIHYGERTIELLKTGRYYQLTGVQESGALILPSITIAFRFQEVSGTSTEYYETQVYVSSPTKILLFPFNAGEIAAGNFHRINGDTVSTLHSYMLQTGWSTIQSTHPYPSYNEYDINPLTKQESQAGIVLPDSIEIIRPFRDSMRQVSSFILMSMEKNEASKCFAYENGKLLLSFRPNFIDPSILSDPMLSHTKGEQLICKYPSIDPLYGANEGYTTQPESFQCEFACADDEKQSFIYFKARIEVYDNESSAVIREVGLNKFREM